MSTQFFHGIRSRSTVAGAVPIPEVATAVIGLVGTAPIHHTASPAFVAHKVFASTRDLDDVQLAGPQIAGYSIPAALDDIRAELGSTVVFINVFDPATHKTDVAEATLTIAADKTIKLAHGDLISLVVKTTADPAVTCVEGTDYTADRITGVITILPGGALAAAASAKVTYSYGNPGAVDDDDIIGTITAGGLRVGAQALLSAQAELGYKPKILIAPEYSSSPAVQQALDLLASKLLGICLADAPLGATPQEVISGRLPDNDLSLLSTSELTLYCYPQLKVPATGGGTKLRPYSPALAGLVARVDRTEGYWVSPSNHQLRRAIGLELPLTASIDDDTCDVNLINAAGIVTVFSAGTSGRRAWGNRNASFPSTQSVMSFVPVVRTMQTVRESIQNGVMNRLDGPISWRLIKAVLDDVNAFIARLVSEGALTPGSIVEARPENNPPAQLAAGKIKFTGPVMPPPPAEQFEFDLTVDTNLLANVFA